MPFFPVSAFHRKHVAFFRGRQQLTSPKSKSEREREREGAKQRTAKDTLPQPESLANHVSFGRTKNGAENARKHQRFHSINCEIPQRNKRIKSFHSLDLFHPLLQEEGRRG
ncbi:hypothetical protein MUK42_35352 [Musa troglodytarum]|uniref:Uncharacterized protein n=1 Tax=Musa troglodytarum TaxID=320322 RepID=A0A9E7GXI8_9LILI|nr:hypothetical protein MUK42_35352 [Musa troglodytarum]